MKVLDQGSDFKWAYENALSEIPGQPDDIYCNEELIVKVGNHCENFGECLDQCYIKSECRGPQSIIILFIKNYNRR
ncbi:UNKNOWN [Stylonychia lemnae]|uniref:Uncharacterized protein n=1 Tax=Stylonychia lemnae TaxID=5949 RepID=A0A078ANS1_STYLE|nr:UNKNOWN [Stylonychia lemnae]|eukprot:CDW82613.1 UNKNOWN [Stylonychia lemnae]